MKVATVKQSPKSQPSTLDPSNHPEGDEEGATSTEQNPQIPVGSQWWGMKVATIEQSPKSQHSWLGPSNHPKGDEEEATSTEQNPKSHQCQLGHNDGG